MSDETMDGVKMVMSEETKRAALRKTMAGINREIMAEAAKKIMDMDARMSARQLEERNYRLETVRDVERQARARQYAEERAKFAEGISQRIERGLLEEMAPQGTRGRPPIKSVRELLQEMKEMIGTPKMEKDDDWARAAGRLLPIKGGDFVIGIDAGTWDDSSMSSPSFRWPINPANPDVEAAPAPPQQIDHARRMRQVDTPDAVLPAKVRDKVHVVT